jgi:hypothetical protein
MANINDTINDDTRIDETQIITVGTLVDALNDLGPEAREFPVVFPTIDQNGDISDGHGYLAAILTDDVNNMVGVAITEF